MIDLWNGRRANALRQASRATNESFASQLGTAVRTVARWNAEPDLIPTVELQRALDTVLAGASPHVRARFSMLVDHLPISRPAVTAAPGAAPSPAPFIGTGPPSEEATAHFEHALALLDNAAGWMPGDGT